jgi:hypothetical protein
MKMEKMKEKMQALMMNRMNQHLEHQHHQNKHPHLQLKKQVVKKRANIPKIILIMKNNQKINSIAIGTVNLSSELYFLSCIKLA